MKTRGCRLARWLHLLVLLPMAMVSLPMIVLAGGQEELSLAAVRSGTFYVKASVEHGVYTDMLLDTGAGYVSLSRETFGRVKDNPGTVFQRYITGVLADGKALQVPIYVIAELRLSDQCILHDVEVAVFKDATRDILGLSALRQMQPLTLNLEPPTLTATCG